MNATGFLIGAYVALVVIHIAYVWSLASRVKSVREELERLEQRRG
jgi:hypothetical protein